MRDRLLAGYFGAGSSLDSYFAAFKLPDLVFNILVLGALTSSFIPVFQKIYNEDHKLGLKLASSVLNLLLIIMLVLSVLLYIFTPAIIPLVVPGFTPDQLVETSNVTRILLVSLIFFTFSNVLSGVLNAWKRFFSFALSSVLYNFGTIIGIIFLVPYYGSKGVAYGVVLGSILHLGAQLWEALMSGWAYRFTLTVDRHLKRIFILMLPRSLGLAVGQFNLLMVTSIASWLPAGQLSVFNFANNLQSFPVGIFGISLAVSAFPSFSRTLGSNNIEGFKKIFSLQFRRIIYFLMPLSIVILLLRAQVVRVILGSGNFDWQATYLTAQVLGYFSLSLIAQGLIPLLARSFYAFEDTKTPVLVGVASVVMNLVLSYYLAGIYGVIGLAIAFSLSSIFNFAVLFVLLRRRFGDLGDIELLNSIRRIAIISTLAGAMVYLALQLGARLFTTTTFVGILAQGVFAGLVGAAVYVSMTLMLNLDEITVVKKFLTQFFTPLLNAVKKRNTH